MPNKKLRIGIAGYGTLGRALHAYYQERNNLERPRYDLFVQDLKAGNFSEAGIMDVLNICFPYSKHFVSDVLTYLREHQPYLCIIHPNVRPGTTKEIQHNLKGSGIRSQIVYSPIIGPRQDLLRSLRLFKKLIGYDSDKANELAVIHLKELGFRIFPIKDSINVELGILIAQSGRLLSKAWVQSRARICKKAGVHESKIMEGILNEVWNPGFAEYGHSQALQPIEKAEVIPESKLQSIYLLKEVSSRNWILDAVLKSNSQRIEEEKFKRPYFIRLQIALRPFKHYFWYLKNRIDDLIRSKKSSKIK